MNYAEIAGPALDVVVGLKQLWLDFMVGDAVIDVDNANEAEDIGKVGYPRWKVVGIGVECTEDCAENEDPCVEFGKVGDPNYFGTLLMAITGTMVVGNKTFYAKQAYKKYMPVDELAAGCVAGWTAGDGFDVEQTDVQMINAIEAAAGAMTAGKFEVIAVVERVI